MVIDHIYKDDETVRNFSKVFNELAKQTKNKWRIVKEFENYLVLQRGSKLAFLKCKVKTSGGVKLQEHYYLETSQENFEELKPVLDALEQTITVEVQKQ